MAGSSNPNMVQPTTNPFMRASTANQQALNTYSNPGAAAANMMNPYNQQVVDTTLRDVGQASQMAMKSRCTSAKSRGIWWFQAWYCNGRARKRLPATSLR